MDETTPDKITLCDFYQQEVLPKLFSRLDRAFPELGWTPTEHDWVGTIEWNDADRGGASVRTIRCNCPWGFELPDGSLVSWAAYIAGEVAPDEEQLLEAVRRLAEMAGVDFPRRRFKAEELEQSHGEFRRQELLEAFFAYCRGTLRGEAGRTVVSLLSRRLCLDKARLLDLPLGLCDSPAEAREDLESLGFSKQEIAASRVVGDSRLADRLIIPWRDRWGRIRMIVADTMDRATDPRAPRLYRRVADCREPFGLDVALRGSAEGKEHLIMLGDIWDVLYFRAQGIAGAASLGGPWRHMTAGHWEMLADRGVRAVTLAMADDCTGREATLKAVSSMGEAERAPRVFALPPGSLDKARTPATFARLGGCGRFRKVLKQRLHAYHYAAEDMVYRHKAGEEWTDAGLTETLAEAVEFDARFYRPQTAWQLDRFFWPTILEQTGAKWGAVRLLLSRPVLTEGQFSWLIDDHQQQVHQIEPPLQEAAEDDYDEMIDELAEELDSCEAAADEECLAEEEPPCETLPFAASQADDEIEDEESEVEVSGVEIAEARDQSIETVTYQPSEEILASTAAEEEAEAVKHVERELVPDPLDIYQLAYSIWERKGRPAGADRECWFEAELHLSALLNNRDAA